MQQHQHPMAPYAHAHPQPAVTCPKCGSPQITANQRGFSGGLALGGAVLMGPLGLLAGTSGKNKILVTCLACGHQWDPSDRPKPKPKRNVVGWAVFLMLALLFGACTIAISTSGG